MAYDMHSEMLAPLSDLVGECEETKTTRKNKVKKKSWHWGDSIHQTAFDNVKKTIAKEVVLAYPDFTKPFDIYTDASTKQLGAVITQEEHAHCVLQSETLWCAIQIHRYRIRTPGHSGNTKGVQRKIVGTET